MPATRLDVRIGENATPVGELLYDVTGDRETSVFTYHKSWLEHPKGFALAPNMPLDGSLTFTTKSGNISALPGPIDDSTPDTWGRAVIKAALGRRNLTDLDFLIEADDQLRSGALRYFDAPGAKGKPLAQPRSGSRGFTIPRLVDLEQVIAEARAFEADPVHYRENRAKLIGGAILKDAAGSLGGARPKVNARDEKGGLWIVKLAKMDDEFAKARAEVLALHLAASVGLRVTTASVLNTSQRFPVALVKRFDRSASGARIPFISAQSFMALPGTETSTYVDIADQIRQHGAAPKDDMLELWKRLAFTILIQNVDDHLRNHGFLRVAAGWRLSPAFDINPDPDEGGTLKTAISEIHGSALDLEAAIEAAGFFDITEDDALQTISQMATTIAGTWRQVGARLGMTSSDFKAVVPAFENERMKLAAELGGRTFSGMDLGI